MKAVFDGDALFGILFLGFIDIDNKVTRCLAPISPSTLPGFNHSTLSLGENGLPTIASSNTPKKHPPVLFYDAALAPERLITPSWANTFRYHQQYIFTDLPQSIMRGIRGDLRYRFDDFLRLGQIPYVLGGLTLAGIFALGKHPLSFARQLAAIGLYYGGHWASNVGIDAWVRAKTGINLNLRYSAANGQIKRVFTDPIFSRYDLLPHSYYQQRATQLGIPPTVADPQGEVQQTIAGMIPRIRLAKAVIGNTLAAIGAGVLARTDYWMPLFKKAPSMGLGHQLVIWCKGTLKALSHNWLTSVVNHSSGLSPVQVFSIRSIATLLLAGALGYGGWLLATLLPKKSYQPAHIQYLKRVQDLFGPNSEQNRPDYMMRNVAIQAFQSYLMRNRTQLTPGQYMVSPINSFTQAPSTSINASTKQEVISV
ncbi:MAG: hypothetical protein U0003_03895 [Vampirovibrionales bacterium]